MPSDIKKMNPVGQVPILLVDGEPVCDSTVIVERVEQLAPTRMDAKLDPAARAEAKLWEEFADTSLNGFTVAARWADEENWPRCRAAFFADAPRLICAFITPRLRARIIDRLVGRDVWRAGPEACWRRFDETLDQLDARTESRTFWLGEHISVADLGIYAQLHSLRCELTPRQWESIASRQHLDAYLDRVERATSGRGPALQRLAS